MAVTITSQPSHQKVVAGETAVFTVAAQGQGRLTYQWSRNGTEILGATEASYEHVARDDDNGAVFVATVRDGSGVNDDSDAVFLIVSSRVPELWDPQLVLGLAIAVGVTFLLVLGSLFLATRRILRGADELAVPGTIAMELMIVGVLALLAGLCLAVLELRAKARTIAELHPSDAGMRELAEVAPKVLNEFGKLRSASALLAVAAVLFAGAAAVGWRSVPQPAPQPTVVQVEPAPAPAVSASE